MVAGPSAAPSRCNAAGSRLHGVISAFPLVWEVGLPIALLAGFPQLYEVHSWTHVMAYTPDLSLVAILAGVLWLTPDWCAPRSSCAPRLPRTSAGAWKLRGRAPSLQTYRDRPMHW